MRLILLLAVLATSACDREPEKEMAAPTPAATNAMTPPETRKSEAPLVVPLPKDQAELDRLILAGYTPHGTHLHRPGLKNCPLAKDGNEAVM